MGWPHTPGYKYESVSEKAFRQHLFISSRYKICLLGLTIYSFISHSFYARRTLWFTTLTVIVCFFQYLVFFDGKEVISFGRIKGDFFSRVYSKASMTVQRWSHHSFVQINRSPMTSTIYSIYRTIGHYLTESLWLFQRRGKDCLLFFDSCGVSWDILSLKILILALLKERKNLIFGGVLWLLNACFSEMELTLVFPLGLIWERNLSGSNYFCDFSLSESSISPKQHEGDMLFLKRGCFRLLIQIL